MKTLSEIQEQVDLTVQELKAKGRRQTVRGLVCGTLDRVGYKAKLGYINHMTPCGVSMRDYAIGWIARELRIGEKDVEQVMEIVNEETIHQICKELDEQFQPGDLTRFYNYNDLIDCLHKAETVNDLRLIGIQFGDDYLGDVLLRYLAEFDRDKLDVSTTPVIRSFVPRRF